MIIGDVDPLNKNIAVDHHVQGKGDKGLCERGSGQLMGETSIGARRQRVLIMNANELIELVFN